VDSWYYYNMDKEGGNCCYRVERRRRECCVVAHHSQQQPKMDDSKGDYTAKNKWMALKIGKLGKRNSKKLRYSILRAERLGNMS
jgi:hypothetical protein